MRNCLFAALFLSAFGIFAAETAHFPEFEELTAPVLFPKNGEITIDRYGNYCLDGRPRFLLGAQIPNKIAASMAPTEGYPDSLKWLYEQVIDYRAAQRVGFDTLSTFVSERWVREIDPEYSSSLFDRETRDALDRVRGECGLPLQADFTCAPWSHGLLAGSREKYAAKVPLSAYNTRGSMSDSNHWTPYCLADPAGRDLYLRMWKSGAEEMKSSGGRVLMYELFNEPAYHDPCPANRKNFIAFLKEKYGTLDAVNTAWNTKYRSFDGIGQFRDRTDAPGLYVDWSKFTEREFVKLCVDGMRLIRSIDPGARFCVQAPGADNYRAISKNHVNLIELAKLCDTVSVSTGGGVSLGRGGLLRPGETAIDTPMPGPSFREDLLQRRFYRAISDGKPVHDGETYTGADYDSLHTALWLQLVRGGNASYLFLWCKRAWDPRWTPQGSEEGGRRLAELMQFHILNPWAFPASGIPAIMDVKKEMLSVDDLFVPRQNYVKPEIGLLLSFPTERRAPAIGNVTKNEVRNTAAALEFLHEPYGVILEEQPERFDPERFPVLIASGVRNLYPGTAERIRRYLAAGGTLIVSHDALPEDEYGRKLDWNGVFDGLGLAPVTAAPPSKLEWKIPPSSRLPGEVQVREFARITAGGPWRVLAETGGKPAVVSRDCGRGKVIYIGVRSLDYHLAAIYDTLLASLGRRPAVELTRAGSAELIPNVEAHCVKNGELAGLFALNLDRYPKLAELALPAGSAAADPLTRELLPAEAGKVLVYLPPRRRALVVTGGEAALWKRFPGLKPVDSAVLRARAAEAGAKLERERESAPAEFRYTPDLRFTKVLDLRQFCNRAFTDSVASDGRGGWTDQGAENCLDGVPWGAQEFCGVPTEILRFDETENRTCIVLDSKNLSPGFGAKEVRGIPVGGKVKNLYFFHCTAWTGSGAEAFHYLVRYADGGERRIPVVCNRNVADWWFGNNPKGIECHPAFRNTQNRGFFVWRWENPSPEREISTLDIVSASGSAIPVVTGITAEFCDPAAPVVARIPLDEWRGYGWFGCRSDWRDGAFAVTLDEKKKDWCGFNLSIPKGSTLRTGGLDSETAFLVFRINGGTDAWGRHTGGQSLQVSLKGTAKGGRKPESATAAVGNFLTEGKVIDSDPATWQEVRIPFAKFYPDGLPEEVSTVSFQFTGIAPEAGVTIAGLAVELPVPAASVLEKKPEPAVHTTALSGWKPGGWLGCSGRFEDGNLILALAPERKQWCGVALTAPGDGFDGSGIDPANSFVCFGVDTGGVDVRELQLGFEYSAGGDGKKESTPRVYLNDILKERRSDSGSAAVRQVKIPLVRFFPKGVPAKIRSFVIQFIKVPQGERLKLSAPALSWTKTE